MKPISPSPSFALAIITAAGHKATKSPHCAAFSTQTSYQQRRHEEESRAVRVSVWWDFENCHVPVNGNAFRVSQSITNAIRANGIKGPIDITAFGDVMQVSRTNQEALSATGINLTHVPSGGKNSADRSLLVDLMYWVSKNPPPAHLFLISGDRDFAGILHRLRMSNYNILLASPDSAPNVLCSAATIMWQWSSLLKGENLAGKLYNQPPDGPYNSWYGHFKAPLEDPFAVAEQSSCSSADESSLLATESKLRPIPKSVLTHISNILKSHPEGISIVHLRAKINISLDKDLYGYRKFSRFLSAMPQVLELNGDAGNILVRPVNTKYSDELVRAAYEEPGTNNGFEVGCDTESFKKKSSCKDVTEMSTVGPVSDPKVKAQLTNLQEAPKDKKQGKSILSTNMQDDKTEAHAANLQDLKKEENRVGPLPKRKVEETQEEDRKVKSKNQSKKDEMVPTVVEIKGSSAEDENKMLVSDGRSSSSGFGIFKRTWMKLFGSRDTKHDKALSEKDDVIQKPSQSSEPVRPALFSPSSHEAVLNGRNTQSGDAASDTSSQSSSWFKFWRSPKSDDTKQLDENKVEKNHEGAHAEMKSKQLEIFEKESFWKEMESFVHSSQGSAVFSKSRTREHVAHYLQKHGPPVLRSLSETDLLHLVDLLISDKQWVEERDFRRYPFRLTHPAGKCQEIRPSSSNGLSHFFSERQPNSPESKDKKCQNHPHTGVPQPIVHSALSTKSRSELLADCQKLIDHIVKEYPEGFNIGGFRKLFLEKYGYPLDPQKLGHEKLANFLKFLPGIIVESNLILPAGAFKNFDQRTGLSTQESKGGSVVDTYGDSSVMSRKPDESDSWDELGPIDSSGSEKDEMDAKAPSNSRKRLPRYEPLREDDFSDSEEEMCSENESKPKLSEESALLDILDSWHGQKEGSSKRDALNLTDSGSNLSSTPKTVSEAVKTARKQKTQMSYTFVKDEPVDSKDKLIDGILGSLKKSSNNSADSQVLS